MRSNRILLALSAIVAIALLSGCICCFGMDSSMSKFKKSVNDISFPTKIDIGGKSYFKQYVFSGVTPDSSKTDAFALATGLGYRPSSFGDTANTLWGLTGITQYKSFIYKGREKNERIHGSIAKTNAPSTANMGYTGVKQAALAALPQANDPAQNKGKVKDIVYDGSVNIGDGGDKMTTTVNGTKCYIVTCKYSNMYVTTCSLESYGVAEQAAQMAIDMIDMNS